MDLQKIKAANAEIGPRARTQINTSNRAAVRRWLTGWGVSSRTARALTLSELAKVYHFGDVLDGIVVPSPGEDDTPFTGNDDDTPQPPTPNQEPQPMETPKPAPAPAETPKPSAGAPDVNQLAAMFAQMMQGNREPVDRDQVAAIVEEMAPDLIAKHSRTIKIEAPDREPVKIEGAHKSLEPLVTALACGRNVWLVGPAGSGKTTLAEQAAKALDRPFYSTGALSSDFRLMGFMSATGEYVRTPFREAFEHGGLFLLDEADASNPNVLVALNQAIDNGRAAFADGMVDKHPEFQAIVAANTYGDGPTAQYVGRTKIDGATKDRFFFLTVSYDKDVERVLAGGNADWVKTVHKARQAAADNGIQHIISPRAIRDGAALLAAGMDKQLVADGTIRKGLDDNSWSKIQRAAGL